MTKLIASAFPILPGKTEEWKKFQNELKTTRNHEFSESREKLGVHERTFLQKTPMGDLVIVTLEGENPEAAFKKIAEGTDAFATWFVKNVKDIHGIDLTQEQKGAMPELIIDSKEAVLA